MPDMMPAVPRIHRDVPVEMDGTMVGVEEAALEVLGPEGAQEMDPPLVEALEERQRGLDRRGAHIREFSPAGFVVRFDGRLVFGQCELEPDERVQMAVGNVMHDLPDRPATVSVRRLELLFVETVHDLAQMRRCRGDFVDELPPLLRGERSGRRLELSNRISRIDYEFLSGF